MKEFFYHYVFIPPFIHDCIILLHLFCCCVVSEPLNYAKGLFLALSSGITMPGGAHWTQVDWMQGKHLYYPYIVSKCISANTEKFIFTGLHSSVLSVLVPPLKITTIFINLASKKANESIWHFLLKFSLNYFSTACDYVHGSFKIPLNQILFS